jgi:hypothetical protein
MIEFRDDDEGYFAWLIGHPSGFVLNVRHDPDPGYVVLHRASCGLISTGKRASGAYTSRGYRKWCSSELNELRAAARTAGREDGTFSSECRLCIG